MTDTAPLEDRTRLDIIRSAGYSPTGDVGYLLAEVDQLRAELATTRRERETATGQLLHFAAEAHRRKWAYDNGGEGPTHAAFAALHQLGNEMRAAVDALTVVSAPTSRPARYPLHSDLD